MLEVSTEFLVENSNVHLGMNAIAMLLGTQHTIECFKLGGSNGYR